ncbi:MAG: hypothetical protein ACRC8S_13430 [Fimbriiglobus sp.]
MDAPVRDAGKHRFAPKLHQTDGGFSASGLLIGGVIYLLMAVVFGVVSGFLYQRFYLGMTLPLVIIMGSILGFTGQFIARRVSLRNMFLATLFGAGPALLMVAIMHYMAFHADLVEREKLAPGATELQFSPRAFGQFVDTSAEQGVTIGKRNNKTNFGYTGTYAFWAVEILGAVAISAYFVRDVVQAPFCVSCQRWKFEKVLANLRGEENEVQEAIDTGELHRFISESPTNTPNIVVNLWMCPECKKLGEIEISATTTISKKKDDVETKSTKLYTYPGEFLDHVPYGS